MEVTKVSNSMLVQSKPHHIHFLEAMSFPLQLTKITNNPNPNFKKFHLIKMLDHHTLEERLGAQATSNQRNQSKRHIKLQQLNLKRIYSPNLKMARREWMIVTTITKGQQPHNNSQKPHQFLIYLILEARTQRRFRATDSVTC